MPSKLILVIEWENSYTNIWFSTFELCINYLDISLRIPTNNNYVAEIMNAHIYKNELPKDLSL